MKTALVARRQNYVNGVIDVVQLLANGASGDASDASCSSGVATGFDRRGLVEGWYRAATQTTQSQGYGVW